MFCLYYVANVFFAAVSKCHQMELSECLCLIYDLFTVIGVCIYIYYIYSWINVELEKNLSDMLIVLHVLVFTVITGGKVIFWKMWAMLACQLEVLCLNQPLFIVRSPWLRSARQTKSLEHVVCCGLADRYTYIYYIYTCWAAIWRSMLRDQMDHSAMKLNSSLFRHILDMLVETFLNAVRAQFH